MLDTAASQRRLLMVDPCADCQRLLPDLQAAGWLVESCRLDNLSGRYCDVGLLRLTPAHMQRPEIIKQMIQRSGTEWIAVLAATSLKSQGMGEFLREWFFDFHTLPFDDALVQMTLGRAWGRASLSASSRFDGFGHPSAPNDELLGESQSIQDLRNLVAKLAPTDAPVLIRGESGTGKELVARTLHRLSGRAQQPFVAINCGAIPEQLIQSELFGHEKGAFTGAHQRKIGRIEAADGGTLFLDEIGDLPLELQVNLLRFLQESHIERVGSYEPVSVNVRVVAATHIDLEDAVRNGRFREDLYYRLNVLKVHTAPLRERVADIPFLAEYYARFYSVETGRRPRRFSKEALNAMAEHGWPGNVRELANRVRSALVLAEGREIEVADLGLDQIEQTSALRHTLEEYKLHAERQALCDALTRYADNHTRAARMLGISRPTFYRLLHKHQLC
ncbi:sigma-54 dependent transcriptional regulator [Pseudomonas schmalbachii]|uniref:Sigma-54-dependent Fis family transcriptional regulator n=1 Tax=Pseudomonas schmalbachii TaxID=2816993 RepID=A0ABS3TJC7_9PSED|nr:sigma-54 dependent transcriptional regulator [Pseudomonas schmalbachii]MBO3273762.1 sigma-54-dependent Fis family transcriptional regulator [Pseudomonas schmalbachii]